MSKHFEKELDRLMRKNQVRCSMCKQVYPKNEIVFTCVGYDKRRKLQTTTLCCHHKLVKVLHLGLSGRLPPERAEEILKSHPLKGTLTAD